MIARTAYLTLAIDHEAKAIDRPLHNKHYLRKHGEQAYYGQKRD
jgi:L-ribulose-5-phosphate 4-epimerase